MAPRSQTKSVILVRHAHRSKRKGREVDNGLSSKGRAQARLLRRIFGELVTERDVRVLSSPMKRCIETAEYIAESFETEVEMHEDLLEAEEGDEAILERRARAFAELCRTMPSSCVIAVSHGDLLPVIVRTLTGAACELEKGGWCWIELQSDGPTIKWIVQDLSDADFISMR